MITEKQLAEHLCGFHAKAIVDNAGGVTLGGNAIADGFSNAVSGKMPIRDVAYGAQALRHWVIAAGYRSDGTFGCVFADSIQNC